MRTATFWLTGWSSARRIRSRGPVGAAGEPRPSAAAGDRVRRPPRGVRAFIRASNSSDCRTGLVRQAAIRRAWHELEVVRAGRRRSGAARGRRRSPARRGSAGPGRARPSRASCRRAARRRTARPRPRRLAAPSRAAGPPSTATGRAPQLVRTSSRIRRLVALSSTTRTGRPSSRGRSGSTRPAIAAVRGRTPSATVKRKVLPRPASLSTQIRPPIISTSLAEIARPRPVPPNRRVVEPSACSNGSKIARQLLGGDADPGVGDGEAEHDLVARRRRPRRSTETTTSPRSVNLIALPTRLTRTWRSRPASPTTASGTSGRDPAGQLQALGVGPQGQGLQGLVERVAEAERRPGRGSSLPASILEKSRMSLMTVSSESAELLTRLEVLALARASARCPGPARSCR